MPDLNIAEFFHSVQLFEEHCKGCVNCIKHCPTEAIRVREGKAHIIENKCIDCGECVRICPNQAKIVITDKLDDLSKYKYNIALPAPAIYGQFLEGTDPWQIVATLIKIGFNWVYDVAYAADIVSEKIRQFVSENKSTRPLISSACPAVVRLVQVRFPNLVEHIIPVISPMRLAAQLALEEAIERTGFSKDEIGLFFISPCPGKVSAAYDPVGFQEKAVTGVISIAEIYPLLYENLVKEQKDIDRYTKGLEVGSGLGIGWARSGGEAQSVGGSMQIAVDGIHSVIKILEDVERGKLSDIDFIEAQACNGGCVGGVLTVENPYITRRRIRLLASNMPDNTKLAENLDKIKAVTKRDEIFIHNKPLMPRPTIKLDNDMVVAIQKMEQMEQIAKNLPGLDCGSCGAPNCEALAEDVVRGYATELDCIFKLREEVSKLAKEMMQLAERVPPSMGKADKCGAECDDSSRDS
ncbi:MAG: [Fe-Fe] hydrogenase large subunit C-terminal domain-containing protein [Armatimonadota bacterium]